MIFEASQNFSMMFEVLQIYSEAGRTNMRQNKGLTYFPRRASVFWGTVDQPFKHAFAAILGALGILEVLHPIQENLKQS